MSDPNPQTTEVVPPRRRRRGRIGVWPVVSALLFAALVSFALLSVSGAPIVLPGWIAEKIEHRFNGALPAGGIRIGRVEFTIASEGVPRVKFRNVEILDGAGNSVAQLNELGAGLSPAALVRGQIVPSVVRLSGAQVTVRRNTDGVFTLDLGGMSGTAATGTLAGVLDAIDRVFMTGPVAGVQSIQADGLTIALEDARSGRIWQLTHGLLTLTNRPDGIAITVASEVFNGTEDLARVQLSFGSAKGSPKATLGVTFENAAAADIALQSPALALLGLLEAPISGSLRAQVGEQGTLEALAATLEIGAGSLRPAPEAQPVTFEAARAYMTYNPAGQRIELSEISARSDILSVSARGQIFLQEFESGWPRAAVAQVRIGALDLAEAGIFEAPLSLTSGVADLKIGLDPFSVDIGQAALSDGQTTQRVSGRVSAGSEGWRIALDLTSDVVTSERIGALWPVRLAPKVRAWVTENVTEGTVRDFRASVRLEPGQRPVAMLDYRFEDAVARVMRDFPPIRDASGRATLVHSRYAMKLDAGRMSPLGGFPADLSGSEFVVPDVFVKPAPAELSLAATAPLDSVLRLMDNPPFNVLKKTERPEDLLATRAATVFLANVQFPLRKGLKHEDVAFDISGTLKNVAADGLVPGRSLEATELSVEITPDTLSVSGPALVGDLPVKAVWRQPVAPGAERGGEAEADFYLTQETLAALGVGLPPGTVTGRAEARVALRVVPGQPVAFTLTSDLVGAALNAPQLGWSKGRDTAGSLSVTGRVSEGRTEIDSLVFEAPGLSARGLVEPGEGPGRATIRFDKVAIGRWLDAPVVLTGRGPGRPPDLRIVGGRADLRELPPAGRGIGTGGSSFRVRLDELQVSDRIALTSFTSELTSGNGFSGRFEGLVNGGTPITGTIVPAQFGPAVRVVSDNGGGVLQDAGLFPNAREGALELILMPREARGAYDGQLKIEGVRLRNAPLLAGLLDAVSIVGIIDQLRGPGIVFDTVTARFDLTPGRIVVREGSAVGASLGISMDGVYEADTKRMDMQGVISPIYLINGIGQLFTRRGEGLFGFSFRLTGEEGATRVQVNPLSILTPGMFRDIFRRPPPEPTQ